MNDASDNLDQALQALRDGRLDALTPEQVARLEGRLNSDPAAAAQLADRIPVRDPVLNAALEELDRQEAPSAAAWGRAWEQIGAAGAVRTRPGRTWTWRLGRPLAVAAACLLMVGFWRLRALPAVEAWPIVLASDVDIVAIEVGEDTMLFIDSTSESGVKVIWALQDEG